ncbi:hypothetical protein M569_15764, partial [Genlisea aurea]
MKKKKKNQNGAATAGPVSSEVLCDAESIIHSNSKFFDHLIELIPPRFYLSKEDDSKAWYQGLTKAAKASMKQQTKQNLRLARLQRFNPDKESASTLDILNKQNGSIGLDSEEAHLVVEGGELSAEPVDDETSVTYEELREKLRRKIESLRGNRGEKKTDVQIVKRSDTHKRKRSGDEAIQHEEDEEEEEIIEYGRVKLGDEDDVEKKKKRKLSKAKELEKAKRLKEAKNSDPSIASRESWKAAARRAMGVKVHDDARLIKDSMNREKRKKEKNAMKWKERVESQEKAKKEKQQKRKQNVAERINEKKMRRIAKREKKLLRPGFEGRKEGYIT